MFLYAVADDNAFESELHGLVPKEEPLVARYIDIVDNVGLSSQLLLLVEGEEEKLDDAVGAIQGEFEGVGRGFICHRCSTKKWLEDNIWIFWMRETFDAILALIGNIQDSKARKVLEKNKKRHGPI